MRHDFEVAVALDHAALEAVLEEVADAAVAAVEPHRVEAVEPVHPGRKTRLRRLDEEVEVVVEDDPGVDDPLEAARDVDQLPDPGDAVVVVEEDRALLDAAADAVVVAGARQI